MADPVPDDASPQGAVPTLLAADLQDHLMTASNDLDRLQRLLADDALPDDDEDGEGLTIPAPLRPNPVTQDEIDAGSIELF